MAVIDEDGRLFGYVNVIDALVVLLVVAVLLAGVALVAGDSGPKPERDTETVAITAQSVPASIGGVIEPGDNFTSGSLQNGFQGTVRDVYLTPASPGQVQVRALVTVPNGSVRIGRSLLIENQDYRINGTVSNKYEDRTSLRSRNAYVTVQTTAPPEIANAISPGDKYRIGGSSVARIVESRTIPTQDRQTKRLRLVMQVEAVSTESGLQFAGTQLSLGNDLTFRTDRYKLSGSIVDLGNQTAGITTGTTPVVVEGTVSADAAHALEAGDTYSLGGQQVTTVRNVVRLPTQQDGQVRIRLALDLQTATIDGERTYLGGDLRVGRTINFATEGYDFDFQLIKLDDRSTGVQIDRTNVVTETRLPETVASNLTAGETYTVDGQDVATIRSIDRLPTGSEDTVLVRLGLDLQIAAIDGENARYLGQPIRTDVSVPFQTVEGVPFDSRIVFTGTTDTGVETGETNVLTSAVVPTSTADAIEVGDTFERRGEVVATVEQVETFPTDNPSQRRIQLGLSLQTVELRPQNETTFLGTEVRPGNTIPFVTEEYSVSSSIVNRGSFTLPGERTDVTATVQVSDIKPTVADNLEAGMTIEQNGDERARVKSLTVEPATVVTQSEGGDIFKREHPINKDVTLTVELSARETRSGLWFNSRPLRVGNDVILDFDVVSVEGSVGDIDR